MSTAVHISQKTEWQERIGIPETQERVSGAVAVIFKR
jgi:hypothetical protein